MSNPANPTFSARVDGHRLVIQRTDNARTCTWCILDLRLTPEFFVKDENAICHNAAGREFALITGRAASHDLLGAVAVAIQKSARKSWLIRRLIGAAAVVLLGAGAFWFNSAPATQLPVSVAAVTAKAAGIARPAPPLVQNQGEWALPESKRDEVMQNMAKAADRKAFTVDYSEGHERTLYVFADPSCPNCQRLEPVLQGISNEFNVVVFPVAVIGKDRSITSVTQVLCLPPEQRKAAWASLFDPGRDGLTAGKSDEMHPTAAEPGACGMASSALAINEVAYKSYRIPGTPWVIADDGRHVPQDTLRDPAKLAAFMAAAAERVNNGAQ